MAGVIYRPMSCGFTGKYGILAWDTESKACAIACPFTDDKDRVDRLITEMEGENTSLEDFENAFLQRNLI